MSVGGGEGVKTATLLPLFVTGAPRHGAAALPQAVGRQGTPMWAMHGVSICVCTGYPNLLLMSVGAAVTV